MTEPNPTMGGDGLVERLRAQEDAFRIQSGGHASKLLIALSEAADRIEALEGELKIAGQYTAAHVELDDLARERATTSEALVTSLRNQLEGAKEALKPFAEIAPHLEKLADDVTVDCDITWEIAFGTDGILWEQKVEHFRLAASTLYELNQEVMAANAIRAAQGTTALLPPSAEPSAARLGYFCPACQAIPQAGYCNLAGCPTAPQVKP